MGRLSMMGRTGRLRYVGSAAARHLLWTLLVLVLYYAGFVLRGDIAGLRSALIDNAWTGFVSVPALALATAPVNIGLAVLYLLFRDTFAARVPRAVVASLTWVIVAGLVVVPHPASAAGEKVVGLMAAAAAGFAFGYLMPSPTSRDADLSRAR
jgi:hypothetical protein